MNRDLHQLEVKDGHIFLDGMMLKGITDFNLVHEEGRMFPELISLEEREIRIAQKEAYQDGYQKGLKECHKLPTRPIILDDSTGDIDFKCSCCGQEYIVPEEHKPKYCSECGRKIDWEDRAYGMQI